MFHPEHIDDTGHKLDADVHNHGNHKDGHGHEVHHGVFVLGDPKSRHGIGHYCADHGAAAEF